MLELEQQALGIWSRRGGALFRPQGIDVGDEVAGGFFVAAEDIGESGFPRFGGAAKVLGKAQCGLGEGPAAGHFARESTKPGFEVGAVGTESGHGRR